MQSFIEWLGNLFTGVLGSIIATIVCAFVASTIVSIKKRKSKLSIKSSNIGGDVVVGDKTRLSKNKPHSEKDLRVSTTIIKDTQIRGDIVQGDKEG
jgi:hypothetical protein